MASTATRKRARRPAKRQSGKRVGDMTPAELRTLIEASVEDTLAGLLRDPDAGLELRPEVVERLLRQEKDYAAGERGRPLEDVVKDLGLA